MKSAPLARRQSLTRTVALKPGKALERHQPLRPRSEKQESRVEEYDAVRVEYLRIHRYCHHCIELGIARPKPANAVHHVARKAQGLHDDPRFFMAVNNEECHVVAPGSIHENPEDSYERGWLISQHLPNAEKLDVLIAKRGHWPHVQMYLEI